MLTNQFASIVKQRSLCSSYQRDVPVDKIEQHENGRHDHQERLVHRVHVDLDTTTLPPPLPAIGILLVVPVVPVVARVGRRAPALVRSRPHSVGLGDCALAHCRRVRVLCAGLDVAVVVEEDEVLQDGDEDEAQAGDDPDLESRKNAD